MSLFTALSIIYFCVSILHVLLPEYFDYSNSTVVRTLGSK